jgi:hypothetical protein
LPLLEQRVIVVEGEEADGAVIRSEYDDDATKMIRHREEKWQELSLPRIAKPLEGNAPSIWKETPASLLSAGIPRLETAQTDENEGTHVKLRLVVTPAVV